MEKKLYIGVIIFLLLLVFLQSIALVILAYDKVIDQEIVKMIEIQHPIPHQQPDPVKKDNRPRMIKIQDDSRPGTVIKKHTDYPDGFKPFTGRGRNLVSS